MDFELAFTDKEITPWGGMALMKRMLDHLGFAEALKTIQLPPKQSSRGERVWNKTKTFYKSVTFSPVFAR
jgi:hypothetical protein